MKKTVVFDFDGVIHSYTSGWQGIAEIPDPPVEGMREAIEEIRAAGFEVVVVSTRSKDPIGSRAVEEYLKKHDIEVDAVMATKPPAIVYVDDRAICFDGNAAALLEKINNFLPWYQKQGKKEWQEPGVIAGEVLDAYEKTAAKALAEKYHLRPVCAGNRFGVFHCWEQLQMGKYGWVQAVVEFPDGSVGRYKTDDIAFLD